MNMFISYSTVDVNIVRNLVEKIGNFVNNIFYWDKDKQPGENAWKQIYQWIDQSDIVLTIITDKTVSRAMSVGNEVGYAIKASKIVIPLVDPGIKDEDLGCLKGITYLRIDRNNINPISNTIINYIIDRQNKQKEDFQKLILVIGMLFIIILLLSEK